VDHKPCGHNPGGRRRVGERTRDQSTEQEDEIVLDLGGVHEPERNCKIWKISKRDGQSESQTSGQGAVLQQKQIKSYLRSNSLRGDHTRPRGKNKSDYTGGHGNLIEGVGKKAHLGLNAGHLTAQAMTKTQRIKATMPRKKDHALCRKPRQNQKGAWQCNT